MQVANAVALVSDRQFTAQYDLDALGEGGIYPNMGMKTVRQG